METSKPLAWVTKTEDFVCITSSKKTSEEKALETWKQLGLRHFQDDQHLIEIRYPPNAIPDGKLRSPVFLDACPSIYYRSKLSSDGWGRTVHMETQKDALPEAIHETVSFTDKFSLVDIGQLPVTPSFDHASFELTFEYIWDDTAKAGVKRASAIP